MSKSINFRLVLSIIGFLLIIETCFMLISLIPSAIYQGGDFSALLISSIITFFSGSILWLQYKRKEDVSLGKREGYIVVSFSWIIFSAFGALPFFLSGSVSTYTDAFFETMSGVTTTGSSIYTDVEIVPKGILFWRSSAHTEYRGHFALCG